uniref:glycine-rich cell wall structural protein 1.0-like n=1 Tax=Fragaria vesca subsp. vesca TaxID=101020 RepID=UPI0005CB4498|nr:PREDICTED: glycine-rich cell wall structural protein 1.0-like [Fragaria vesca subsp. vesca]
MKNFKAFNFLGLLFALVIISSIVTADEKPKEENKAVAVEATKETNLVPGDIETKGYGGGGGGGGCGCCYKYGGKYCGKQCCWPQNEETEAASDEAAADANPDGYGWGGGRGGGGWGGGRGGGGYGGGRGV